MIDIREALVSILKCIRAQQTAVIDNTTSLGALLEYAEEHAAGFRAYFEQYQTSDREVSGLLAELARLFQVINEVIERLESGEALKV
ncbi:MAG: hypothetical protein ABSA41_15290 [Terriglobia bacterium]|jgi:DNA anti-recombination protein RmuC